MAWINDIFLRTNILKSKLHLLCESLGVNIHLINIKNNCI